MIYDILYYFVVIYLKTYPQKAHDQNESRVPYCPNNHVSKILVSLTGT